MEYFAMNSSEGRIAIEVDGNTWHEPSKISEDKYHDDLLKQNSIVFEGWKYIAGHQGKSIKRPSGLKMSLSHFWATLQSSRILTTPHQCQPERPSH